MAQLHFNPGATTRIVASGAIAGDLARRAARVEAAAKRLCPVDTGRLRASIGWSLAVDGRGPFALVGTAVEYAPFVEYGTSRMAARPFLRPALSAAGGI